MRLIPTVATDTRDRDQNEIKWSSREIGCDQAIKKVVPCLSIKIKAVHRLDSTHFLSSIKDQGFFNGAIKRSRPKISSIKF